MDSYQVEIKEALIHGRGLKLDGDQLVDFAAYALSYDGGPHGEEARQLVLDHMKKHKAADVTQDF